VTFRFVAQCLNHLRYLSGLFTYQIKKKTEQNYTPLVAAAATLNGPVLPTVFAVSRLSIGFAGSKMATLL
jgi:hypothetical protein